MCVGGEGGGGVPVLMGLAGESMLSLLVVSMTPCTSAKQTQVIHNYYNK